MIKFTEDKFSKMFVFVRRDCYHPSNFQNILY